MLKFNLSPIIYLTDFHRDYTFEGSIYQSGMFELDESVKQGTEPSAGNFKIQLSAIDGTMVNAFADHDYKNKQCLITRVEIDDDNESIVVGSEIWLDGTLNNYNFTNTDKTSYLSVTVGSIFNAFDMVKKRNLDIYFAETINNDEKVYWGKSAPAPERTPTQPTAFGTVNTNQPTQQ
jgi:hypothetical protein